MCKKVLKKIIILLIIKGIIIKINYKYTKVKNKYNGYNDCIPLLKLIK